MLSPFLNPSGFIALVMLSDSIINRLLDERAFALASLNLGKKITKRIEEHNC